MIVDLKASRYVSSPCQSTNHPRYSPESNPPPHRRIGAVLDQRSQQVKHCRCCHGNLRFGQPTDQRPPRQHGRRIALRLRLHQQWSFSWPVPGCRSGDAGQADGGQPRCAARRGAKSVPNGARRAVRGGSTSSQVVFGGQRIEVHRPTARSVTEGELTLARSGRAAGADPLDADSKAAIAAGVSTRGYASTLEIASLPRASRRLVNRCARAAETGNNHRRP